MPSVDLYEDGVCVYELGARGQISRVAAWSPTDGVALAAFDYLVQDRPDTSFVCRRRSRVLREHKAEPTEGTLGYLKARAMGLTADCTRMHCGHGQELDLALLIKRFGGGSPYINEDRIAAACRCARCGQRGATLRVRGRRG